MVDTGGVISLQIVWPAAVAAPLQPHAQGKAACRSWWQPSECKYLLTTTPEENVENLPSFGFATTRTAVTQSGPTSAFQALGKPLDASPTRRFGMEVIKIQGV